MESPLGLRTVHEPNEWSPEVLFGLIVARRTENPVPNWSSALRFMESPLSLFRMHWDHELPGGCSAGVLACECIGRPARCSCGRRDAAATRSRDGCATRFMESLRMRPRSSSPFAPASHPFGNLRAHPLTQ